MPIYDVSPLSLAEASDRFATVAATFGLTDTSPITQPVMASEVGSLYASSAISASHNGLLLMDPSAGNVSYADPKRLWSEQALVNAADSSGMMAIDQNAARAAADH
jgi:hypothetical protein